MGSYKAPMKRLKHFEYFGSPTTTERVCSRDDCEEPATFVGGHYTVENRRVRVWVCLRHKGNPLTVLPVPADIQAGLDAEAEYRQQQENWYAMHADFDTDHGVSVKMIAGTGHGNPISGDRVKQWRWDTKPRELGIPTGRGENAS